MHRPPKLPALCAAPALAMLVACGGGQAFGTTYDDNRRDRLAGVEAQLRAAPPTRPRAVAVGASADAREIFAYDLQARRLLWRKPAAPVSPPLLAADLVALHEAGTLKVLRLEDGELVTQRDDGMMSLMGAAGEGSLAAVVFSTGGSTGARSELLIFSDGELVTELEAPYALGAPAVRGGLVFVPWNNVFLSVLAPDGSERARVRVQGDVVSRAFAAGREVYFGQLGMFRFDPALADLQAQKRPGLYFRPERTDLPGNPAFLPPANQPPPPVQSALYRVALSFHPAPRDGDLGLLEDQLYLTFYRHVFALHPSEASAAWLYEHPLDIVGSQALESGLLLADEAGNLALVDHQGRARWTAQLGLTPSVVQFRAAGFAPPLTAPEPAPPLADQLARAALNVDARLVPSQVMAVEMLGSVEGDAATAHLIALCDDAPEAPRVRDAACATLAERSSGPEPVLEALERHANHLTGTDAPPVGSLASAAAHMDLKAAVPSLLAHLRDPATPVEALPALMEAIKQLSDESASEPVRAFLMLYHADEQDPHMLRALSLAMETLVAQRGAEAAPTLERIANDGLGLPPLRGYARELLAALPQQDAGADDAQASPGADEGAESASEEVPAHLDEAHLEQALGGALEDMRVCLRKSPQHPASARLTIVVDGEGKVVLVRTLPTSLLDCIEPLVAGVRFPPNKYAKRQQLHYRLER